MQRGEQNESQKNVRSKNSRLLQHPAKMMNLLTSFKIKQRGSFPSWNMAGEKAEKPDTKEKNLKPRRLRLVARLKR